MVTAASPIIARPSARRQQQSRNEEMIDRFAILFTPATPPASPAFNCHPTRPTASPLHSWQPDHSTSSDTETFNSFVSVPASHDPLLCAQPLIDDTPPIAPINSPGLMPDTQTSINQPDIQGQNSSWNFFDKFTEDAKRASERNKRGVLDELLLHEDDPLYWLKDEAENSDIRRDAESPAPSIEPDGGDSDGSISQGAEPKPDTIATLVDLQFVDLTKKDVPSSDVVHDPGLPPRPNSVPLYNSEEESQGSSSSLTTHSSISTPGTPIPSGSRSSSPSVGLLTSQRPGYGSLTTLSSRLMSTLLSSSQPSPATTTAHNSVDTLFANKSAPSSKSFKRTYPTAQSSLPNVGPNPYPHLHHAQSIPTSRILISHGTPFASHSYTPPSGAPGFTGDDHAWDKGFSEDYDKEKVEKRSVLLKGRKEGEGYVHVLCVRLADMIRPCLPALSRLPRTWTLLYSIDQHGISLNTLYTRCETQRSKVGVGGAGTLLVIKDSGDALFGVWMGEGIMMSKGAYYGSGESFLWRYIGGKLDIFKWTGKNDYVALCEPEYISFGGGDGNYGLYLDETLLDGSSARCPTFGNEPLCSPGQKKGGAVAFECVGLEVWGIGS